MLMRLPSRSGYLGFRVIGFLKLLSGLVALIMGMGFVHFIGHDPGPRLERMSAHLGLDPQNHLIHRLMSALTGIDRSRLRAIEAGTFFYAILHLIEGIGLILERDWAGYLVVLATSSLIPFELYEIIQKHSLPRVTLLILNVGILIYLIVELRKHHAARAKPTDQTPNSSVVLAEQSQDTPPS
jgi:uncharacterized membrane protein (DUF2068 family)